MSEYYGMPRSAKLVSRHLHSLFGDARREGVTHEELTIELAAHATCAALSFWPAEELHALIDVADEDTILPGEASGSKISASTIIPFPRRNN